MTKAALAGLAACLALVAAPQSRAQEPVKIGFINTLSGANAVLGQETLDGFNLAIKLAGGKLGPSPVQMVVGDDQMQPDVGRQLVDKMGDLDHVDLYVGRHVLQRAASHHPPDRGAACDPDQPQRGAVGPGGAALLAQLLRRARPQRRAARGRRRLCGQAGLQARVPDGAQLRRRQGGLAGFKRTFGPTEHRGRGLHAAEPARLRRRAGPAQGRQARRCFTSSIPAGWRSASCASSSRLA